MSLFDALGEYSCESVTLVGDDASGLRAVIAVHSTQRGPAFGGIRTLTYANEEAGVLDAARLASAMSFKAAAADLPAGGGKAVVLKHAGMDRATAFRALGRAIERLGGRYFTGLDVGTTREDLYEIATETGHVARDFDFGKATARGVLAAIKAALEHRFGETGLAGRSVAVQGVGAVGSELAAMLHAEGAELFVSDMDRRRAMELGERLGCEVVAPENILRTSADVLAPCALGGVFTSRNAEQVEASIICGSANNQLATPAAGDALREAGVDYVPDFVANAGALIKGVTEHIEGREVGFEVVDRIGENVRTVLERASKEGRGTQEIAGAIAKERLA